MTETIVCGLAALPAVAALRYLARTFESPWLQTAALAIAIVPAYVLFALCLMPASAASTWLTGARTPAASTMPIGDMGWPLLRWVRYMAAIHVVRTFAGLLFRGTPIWSWYLRLNGARVGRRVYVNSLFVSDHNMLDFGNDVVVGADVHLSGHTVERGTVYTGTVMVGDGATIGLGSMIDIDVVIGAHAQVGALSMVPKHARLEGNRVYVGIPAKPLEPPAILGTK